LLSTEKNLEKLRLSFPQPVSDCVHDAYFVFSILRALDQVDAMKSETPMLGTAKPLDYDAARKARLPPEGSTVEHVTKELVERLEGLPVWGHPRSQLNVVAPPSIASSVGALLPSIYNPNFLLPGKATTSGSTSQGGWASVRKMSWRFPRTSKTTSGWTCSRKKLGRRLKEESGLQLSSPPWEPLTRSASMI
jgi:hypothetical protein